jgi:hypothetical protein
MFHRRNNEKKEEKYDKLLLYIEDVNSLVFVLNVKENMKYPKENIKDLQLSNSNIHPPFSCENDHTQLQNKNGTHKSRPRT